MNTFFPSLTIRALILTLIAAITCLAESASATSICSWIFAPSRMILDARRELIENPHSVYYIGQHVREENLRAIIERK